MRDTFYNGTLEGRIEQTGRWRWHCHLSDGVMKVEPGLNAWTRKGIVNKFHRHKAQYEKDWARRNESKEVLL